jgi:putative nucleotidyltransferase with HDIG domain
MIKMSDIIAEIEFLPPFSKVAQKAIQIIKKDDFSMNELSELVKYDPALTANILKVANSAAFVTAKEVNDLHTALTLIGVRQLSSIIMMSAAKRYFDKHMPGYEYQQGEIWQHSLATAVISEELNHYEPGLDPSVLFTAALLHDIGKIILSQYVAEEYQKILRLIEEQDIDFITAERKVIGFTHPVVGSAILKKWNFSSTITEVAKFHKTPQRTDDPYVHIVALADFIAFMIGHTSQKDGLAYQGYEYLLNKYNIKSQELDEIISLCSDKVREVLETLKI